MRTKYLLFVIVALMLTSCAQPTATTVEGVPLISTDIGTQYAEVQLAQAATAVQQSLQELAKIQRAVHPAARLPKAPSAKKIGMAHLASVDWSGPIEPLVRNIAQVTNYRLRVLGRAPAIPVLVSIYQHNVPLAEILRNAGFQCGNRVDIVVYPGSRVIELRYAPV